MIRAIPILIIVGLAVYSFFEVVQTPPQRIRRYSRTFWLVASLIPVFGAMLWFAVGRPKGGTTGSTAPRVISLRNPNRSPAPDDDPAFLRRLDEEAWRLKREEQRKRKESGASETGRPQAEGPPGVNQPKPPSGDEPPRRPNEGPAPGGPGIAPAG